MITRRSFSLGLAAASGLSTVARPARAERPRKKHRDGPNIPVDQIPNHRQYMRDIVETLSSYGKSRHSDFIVLTRNAPELLIKEQREADWEEARDPDGSARDKYPPVGSVNSPYLAAIDGILFDGLYFGHDAPDQPTDAEVAQPLLDAATLLRAQGRRSLTIEYCANGKLRTEAAKRATQAQIIPFLSDTKDLGRIPSGHPAGENARHITSVSQMANFLPLLNSQTFTSHEQWVLAMEATNYDMLLVDPFWHGRDSLTYDDVKRLRYKQLGSRRLLIAVLPIGTATKDRHYWKGDWVLGSPSWLAAPDPTAPAQYPFRYLVEYWNEEWKEIIGKPMAGFIELGFDGVLLDAVDSYLYFEDLTPL